VRKREGARPVLSEFLSAFAIGTLYGQKLRLKEAE
jgi:hypothetical protein